MTDPILFCQIVPTAHLWVISITPRDIKVNKFHSGSIAVNSGMYFVQVGVIVESARVMDEKFVQNWTRFLVYTTFWIVYYITLRLIRSSWLKYGGHQHISGQGCVSACLTLVFKTELKGEVARSEDPLWSLLTKIIHDYIH